MILFSMITFTAYCIAIALTYGVQRSISQTYYTLEYQSSGLGSVFTLWMWVFLIPLLWVAPNDLFRIAVIIEMFVGGAPAFLRHNLEKNVHNVASYLGIIVGLVAISIYLDSWVYPLIVGLVILAIRVFDKETHIWWIEVVAFFGILIPLL